MKKLLLTLTALLLIPTAITSMEPDNSLQMKTNLEEPLLSVQLNESEPENQDVIDDINYVEGEMHIAMPKDDYVATETWIQKTKKLLHNHKHALHAVGSGALAFGSVWLLGQDNPTTSMIFLNGFAYNLGRLLPKKSEQQALRFVLPAIITAGMYGVDVLLNQTNVDTNWAFGLIGASIAQVAWTKRLHKPKNNTLEPTMNE